MTYQAPILATGATLNPVQNPYSLGALMYEEGSSLRNGKVALIACVSGLADAVTGSLARFRSMTELGSNNEEYQFAYVTLWRSWAILKGFVYQSVNGRPPGGLQYVIEQYPKLGELITGALEDAINALKPERPRYERVLDGLYGHAHQWPIEHEDASTENLVKYLRGEL